MKLSLFLIVLAHFWNLFSCFDYCSLSNYHMFCGVDCLRAPRICSQRGFNRKNTHSQVEVTQKSIDIIAHSLNTLRMQAVQGTMDFITNYWPLGEWKNFKYNLEKRPQYMNILVRY